ncbi:MAG: DHH family phosphoesterase [Candidatus Aenigmarchaeota archaeon]|nr:DHH family phosphoesterase [Candidatus Aenigmarchaeota archaeon]
MDADGISAASIALSALTRMRKKVHLSTEKQVKPELIERLKGEKTDIFLFTDLGSGYLDLLNELGESTHRKIIVADHHLPSPQNESYKNIIQINPYLIGRDENEISGAGVMYLLARELDEGNKDLSYLAIIGAIGDMQDNNGWEMKGMNAEILKESVEIGNLKKIRGIRLFGRMNRPVHKALEYSTDPYIPGITGNESAAIQFLSTLGIGLKDEGGRWRTLNDLSNDEMKKLATAIICERIREKEAKPEEIFGDNYTIKFEDDEFDAREMATSLNACGRMGQSSLGILSALGMPFGLKRLDGVLSGYRKMINRYIRWTKENEDKIIKTKNAYYILAGDQIHENFIGTITSICEKSSILNNGRVVFGFAYTEDGEVKVSARAPKEFVERGLSLKDLFEKVAKEYNGYGGGHQAAAGAFIPIGKEKEFINACENYLESI